MSLAIYGTKLDFFKTMNANEICNYLNYRIIIHIFLIKHNTKLEVYDFVIFHNSSLGCVQ